MMSTRIVEATLALAKPKNPQQNQLIQLEPVLSLHVTQTRIPYYRLSNQSQLDTGRRDPIKHYMFD